MRGVSRIPWHIAISSRPWFKIPVCDVLQGGVLCQIPQQSSGDDLPEHEHNGEKTEARSW